MPEWDQPALRVCATPKRLASPCTGQQRPARKPRRAPPADEDEAEPSTFSVDDAACVASSYRFQFGRKPRSELFREYDAPCFARYEALRRSLGRCRDLSLVGFHLFEGFVTAEEAALVLRHCDSVERWERRLGAKEEPIEGTRRMNYGVAMSKGYRPSAVGAMPRCLASLAERVLRFCVSRGEAWPTRCTDFREAERFDQAYVQRYTPGQTLGFHYDGRRHYGELICGLTICGDASLLLSNTVGGEAVAPGQHLHPNVARVRLPPLSLYVLSGMARFDLRHAIVQEGPEERISVTFRSLAREQRRREA